MDIGTGIFLGCIVIAFAIMLKGAEGRLEVGYGSKPDELDKEE